MEAAARRWVMWGTVAGILALLLVSALRPQALPVEVVVAAPGPFRVTLEAEGMARVRNVFTISAPVAGHSLRNPLEVGDALEQGQTVVATIEPADPAFLDPRAQAESRQDVQAAEAELELAQAELARAEADRQFAAAELGRAEELFSRGSVPTRFVDEARRAFQSAEAAVAAARAAGTARAHQLLRVKARLITPPGATRDTADCNCIRILAPVSGRVLKILVKSAAVVPAGAPLIEIGDPRDLEIVADYLSADAVKIAVGQSAEIVGWGGAGVLSARVRRVEPFGFTKISALGIEEQRVNVVFDLEESRERWQALGHGYRVITRVISSTSDSALTLPVTAMFRHDGRWFVFVVDGDVARLQAVEAGARAGLDVEVTAGIAPGESVLVNPPESLRDGDRVAPEPVATGVTRPAGSGRT